MQKRGLWIFAVVIALIIVSIFIFRDNRNMADVEKEQLESAADSADSKLNDLNEGFDDFDFDESEIEDATLAYDTIH